MEKGCRIIATTVTGRASSVRVPSVGKQRRNVFMYATEFVSASPSLSSMSIFLVGLLYGGKHLQMIISVSVKQK